MTSNESVPAEFDVNNWLSNVYGLTDDSSLNAAEVEELCEMIVRDVLLAKDTQIAEVEKRGRE